MLCAVYVRVSRDATAEGLGVDRQESDCRALAEKHRWEVIDLFADNDISASTSSRQSRPEYDRMLGAVRRGEVHAILAYSNSRLTRRPLELEDLITLHEKTGVLIVTVVSGADDLSTADGRLVARIKASVDAAEAERTSERLRRQKADRAARGLPQGGRYRVYGYTRAFEPIDAEALLVVEVFERRAAGQSATSIAAQLAGRGLVTAAGKPWTQSSVSKMISRPGYAGLREYNGQIVGKTAYPGLVEESVWRAANGAAAKSSPGTNARRWLLSSIAVCARCLTGMIGNSALGAYRCNRVWGGCGNTKIKWSWIEGPVVSLVLAREGEKPCSRLAAPLVDLGPIDAEIEAVRRAYGSGDLALEDMTPLLRDLRVKRREAEQQAASTPVPMTGPIFTWASWVRADISEQRVLIGRHVDSVLVGPRRDRGPGRYDPERLTVRWVDGHVQAVTGADLSAVPNWRPETRSFLIPADMPIVRMHNVTTALE